MELVRLFWRELCTDLFRSKNEISPGHRLEFRLNFCPSGALTWSQAVVLAARNVIKHTHLPFIVTQCELSSLCSAKGDNKIPTDIWLTEWFSSLFLKVVMWGVCLLACPVCEIRLIVANEEYPLKSFLYRWLSQWPDFLLLLSYRIITSFALVLVFFIMMVIFNQLIPLYFGRSFTWGALYAALVLLSSLTGRG